MAVKKGDHIKVDYEGRFEDGTVFDSSKHGDHVHLLEFDVGAGMVIPGFDNAVVGMEKGAEKEIKIEPKDAYGEYNDELIQKIPRSALPRDQEPKAGMTLVVGTPQGQQFPVKIKEVSNEEVTLDLNHPLAGKVLIFKLKIAEII
jgi:FKBP-type peptidyl-prolyl cis-trans isomerase 2